MKLYRSKGNGKGTCKLCSKPIDKGQTQVVIDTSWDQSNRRVVHLVCLKTALDLEEGRNQ